MAKPPKPTSPDHSSPPPIARIFRSLPHEHPGYLLIGRVASEWAELEHTLDRIIWELASLDAETGACITAQIIGHRPRFEMILALAEHISMPADVIKQISKLLQVTSEVVKERNRIVHDAWWYDEHTGKLAQFMSPRYRHPRFGLQPIEETEVTRTVETIRRRVSDVRNLRNALVAQMRASREKRK
jgi:hypothetical protein